jgi:hypothetical protein
MFIFGSTEAFGHDRQFGLAILFAGAAMTSFGIFLYGKFLR